MIADRYPDKTDPSKESSKRRVAPPLLDHISPDLAEAMDLDKSTVSQWIAMYSSLNKMSAGPSEGPSDSSSVAGRDVTVTQTHTNTHHAQKEYRRFF